MTVFPVAMVSGFVGWQPGWPELTAWFLVNNLLLTSLTEEAFFRGFFQGNLSRYLPGNVTGAMFAIMVPALTHGVGHYPGGALCSSGSTVQCFLWLGLPSHRLSGNGGFQSLVAERLPLPAVLLSCQPVLTCSVETHH